MAKAKQSKMRLTVQQTNSNPGKRYHLANWFEGPKGGARAKTNIPGMVCPRCNFALEADVEHTCGNLKGIEPLS